MEGVFPDCQDSGWVVLLVIIRKLIDAAGYYPQMGTSLPKMPMAWNETMKKPSQHSHLEVRKLSRFRRGRCFLSTFEWMDATRGLCGKLDLCSIRNVSRPV